MMTSLLGDVIARQCCATVHDDGTFWGGGRAPCRITSAALQWYPKQLLSKDRENWMQNHNPTDSLPFLELMSPDLAMQHVGVTSFLKSLNSKQHQSH